MEYDVTICVKPGCDEHKKGKHYLVNGDRGHKPEDCNTNPEGLEGGWLADRFQTLETLELTSEQTIELP